MDCYKLVDGSLQTVPDPTDQQRNSDTPVHDAGYTIPVCSSAMEVGGGTEISIYETELLDRPRYYIDLMGESQSIAALVADDFPSLLATLKALQPLTAVMGLSQQAWIQTDASFARTSNAGR